MSPQAPALLTLSGVSKHFGGVQALIDIDIAFEAGRVHALVGENGAGKSTLGKLILGIHRPSAGKVRLDGHEVAIHQPADALGLGLVGIAQELSLMPRSSVLDNIALGREVTRHGLVDRTATLKAVTGVMERFDMRLDPHAIVGTLPVAERQKVEILRALSRDARLIIFDEPTARLATYQAKQLLTLIRSLAAAGKAVIYVSHFLEEILEVADTITILRNGRLIRTGPAAAETRETLVAGVTGQNYQSQFPKRSVPPGGSAPVLRVRDLSSKGLFEGVDLNVHAGEIVGLAGLVGAGRSEVAHAIYGAAPVDSGTIEFDGKALTRRSIRQRIDAGMAIIPESRRDQALFLARPILENVSLPHLKRFSNWLGLRKRAEKQAVTASCADTSVKYTALGDHVDTLSGGNQQKILFARAALGRPRLLIADEPTRGVDVGAKRSIYEMIVRLAEQGEAILLISSEIEEIMGLCHRVVVLSRGRVAAQLSGQDLTEQAVMQAAFSGG
ncbi:MAG: sugar ABC transporter ATP-binding protein [Devosia nanyangense]|uniref:Sugar ABC transporter ATP-binding protein n=1 Tax=Devosia nanyangense TaxID=1228055 RepID=A0A933L2K6_9HYPH|nr:sugar ABC transporter ATP-binding protein [Devosia nanyangense]